ncbi:dynamin family protein [Nosocomiicoccus sp. HMSC09A07]|uniref:dynamin family protein n=1 Tax=Nosocomiicoccus sp. HMSC09A07 TaxID=1581145 RepID=UPI0008A48D8A|nr:dynamin family protein [Nosocomiicoccus sp. HMSC09A07]OFS64266.1 hypothetical protein HMPREF3177_01690 [Nosocomiicoccus sp. HMSC09A07]
MVNDDTLNILYKIRKEISKSNNKQLLSEIDYTIKKVYDDLFVVSFIGHFSARKSSLINYLLEDEVLPSSPIPTTSKTVQIEICDETRARVYIDKNHYVKLNDLSEVKQINKKDVEIEYVKIMHDSKKYNDTFVFQDTPGVDSKTSAHEESTHKFLLNSDYVFFTVEYNHVESESNLSFLEEIASYNIPFSLIVNQIDKHDDSELSYDTFINRLKSTLSNHNIHPEHIFTTSIYGTPYRQNDQLESFLKELDDSRASFKKLYHERIIQNIEQKHIEYLDDQLNSLDVDSEIDSDLKTHIHYLLEEKQAHDASHIKSDIHKLTEYVDAHAKDIVSNSYLFPHDVKDSIREYFKISTGDVQVKGLFGKKKKLQAMKEDQVKIVHQLMQDVIDRQINTQINDLFLELKISSNEYFKYEYHDALLTDYEIVESNEKILDVYLGELKQTISKEVRNLLKVFIKQLDIKVYDVNPDDTVDEELNRYKKALQLAELKSVFLSGSYKHLYTHVEDELKALNENIELSLDTIKDLTEKKEDVVSYDFKSTALDTEKFYSITDLIKESNNYRHIYKLLTNKLNRLKHNEANISVFGGFSAGKSTFINALLKEKLLTTSPNPTTASITEISNSDKSYIQYKSEESIVELLESVTGKSNLSLDDQVKQLNKMDVPKLFVPLKNGVNKNLETYRPLFGQKIETTREDIDFKTSEDSHAIFIDKAFIGHHAPLLDQFTIIDSPGINSINERHTQETHQIIANSDLIIYVSYFNHVFTQSDAQFLKYIQSIKGKEFPLSVVINAVDLAKNDREIEDVEAYMHQSLNQLKIQHQIYGVSSKYALEHDDASFEAVKLSFLKDAENKSKELLALSIDENIKQFIELLNSNIKQFDEGESFIYTLKENRHNTSQLLNDFSAHTVKNETVSEIENLFAFIRKQLELKLYDYLSSNISMNDVSKKMLSANRQLIKNDIEQYVTIESNTIINNVYRFIDDLVNKHINDFNVKLRASNVVDTLQYPKVEQHQVKVSVDDRQVNAELKRFEKSVKTHKQLREQLLEVSKTIVDSIQLDALKDNVIQNATYYFNDIDHKLLEDKTRVLQMLNTPIEAPDEVMYKESIDLLNEIHSIVGEENDNH